MALEVVGHRQRLARADQIASVRMATGPAPLATRPGHTGLRYLGTALLFDGREYLAPAIEAMYPRSDNISVVLASTGLTIGPGRTLIAYTFTITDAGFVLIDMADVMTDAADFRTTHTTSGAMWMAWGRRSDVSSEAGVVGFEIDDAGIITTHPVVSVLFADNGFHRSPIMVRPNGDYQVTGTTVGDDNPPFTTKARLTAAVGNLAAGTVAYVDLGLLTDYMFTAAGSAHQQSHHRAGANASDSILVAAFENVYGPFADETAEASIWLFNTNLVAAHGQLLHVGDLPGLATDYGVPVVLGGGVWLYDLPTTTRFVVFADGTRLLWPGASNIAPPLVTRDGVAWYPTYEIDGLADPPVFVVTFTALSLATRQIGSTLTLDAVLAFNDGAETLAVLLQGMRNPAYVMFPRIAPTAGEESEPAVDWYGGAAPRGTTTVVDHAMRTASRRVS